MYDGKFLPAATGGQSNTAVLAFPLVRLEWQAEVCFSSYCKADWRRLALAWPVITLITREKRQQYGEFNDRSNCCGSPTLCCGGVMNDSRNAPRCEEIVAAC